MNHREHNSRLLAAMRTGVLLLLFLPAHIAFALLIDLDFIPVASGPTSVGRNEPRAPDKERLRLHLLRQSEARGATVAVRDALVTRHFEPWSLSLRIPVESSSGESVGIKLTAPGALELWLAATPHNHRAPPA